LPVKNSKLMIVKQKSSGTTIMSRDRLGGNSSKNKGVTTQTKSRIAR